MRSRAKKPWRMAFRLDFFLPSGVLGPVERRALRRMAASFLADRGIEFSPFYIMVWRKINVEELAILRRGVSGAVLSDWEMKGVRKGFLTPHGKVLTICSD